LLERENICDFLSFFSLNLWGFFLYFTAPTSKDKITLPADLPIERQVLDISEEAKVCPETGKPLVKIGEEVTSKIAHRPGSYFIKQIVRPKYALPQKSEGGVLTAALPEMPFDTLPSR
jgi:transposase